MLIDLKCNENENACKVEKNAHNVQCAWHCNMRVLTAFCLKCTDDPTCLATSFATFYHCQNEATQSMR